MKHPSASRFVQLAPALFVFLWATGFVGAKFGTNDADAFSFLAVRFVITTALLALLILLWVRPRGLDWHQFGHSMIVGCLIHGLYLGGVFYAVDHGMGAGLSSLLVALQPFFTAIFAWVLLGEKLSGVKALCFLVALFGVFLVLFPNLELTSSVPGVTPETITACLLSTIGISMGTVYQKRAVVSLNLWISTAGQFAGASILMGILALVIDGEGIVWTTNTILTMAWLILVLSIGAVVLLMFLLRQGEATSVASLFFLVPVVAMFTTWLLFDEKLSLVQIIGSAVVVVSVAYASRLKQNAPA